jgi:hypothetical protein
VDVTDHRVHGVERAHAVHARALEVDRVEIHQDIRPVDPLQDVPADIGMKRRAVVVSNMKAISASRSDRRHRFAHTVSRGALRVVLEFQP